jgi:hypothetical protein
MTGRVVKLDGGITTGDGVVTKKRRKVLALKEKGARAPS